MIHLLLTLIYLSFISLGLPDSLLGAGWPSMYVEFGVPVSYAGAISMLIGIGTVISSMMCDRISRRVSTGKLTAISVAATASALYGFSVCREYWQLCLWALPYGLGAGCVDAALNNYVAKHFATRHMCWLNCMWGLGTVISPYVMGFALTSGRGWHMGYRYISVFQIVLTIILIAGLPLWKLKSGPAEEKPSGKPLTIRQVVSIRGAMQAFAALFFYCALEQTAMLWAASYMVGKVGMSAEAAASMASLFCIGITVGRGLSGFVSMRMSDTALIRLGEIIIGAGALCMLLPLGKAMAMAGFILIGFGCAPIYPCLLHSTPVYFGAENSQAIIGMQMAFAYVGICCMPPLFGLIANHISVNLLPVYLLLMLAGTVLVYEMLLKRVQK